jgi:hypothetical protein
MNVFWFMQYLFIAFECNATVVESFWLSACDRKRLEVGRILTVISTQLLAWGFMESRFQEPPSACWRELTDGGHRSFFRMITDEPAFRASIHGILYQFSFHISYPTNIYWQQDIFLERQILTFGNRTNGIITNRFEWFEQILSLFAVERTIDPDILNTREIPERIEQELNEYL